MIVDSRPLSPLQNNAVTTGEQGSGLSRRVLLRILATGLIAAAPSGLTRVAIYSMDADTTTFKVRTASKAGENELLPLLHPSQTRHKWDWDNMHEGELGSAGLLSLFHVENDGCPFAAFTISPWFLAVLPIQLPVGKGHQ